MSLGKLSQEKFIEESLRKEFEDKFTFEFPIVYYENQDYIFNLNIDSSDLGLTSLGKPEIVFKNIKKGVNLILDKYNIIYSKWNSGLQNPKNWIADVSYLHTNSEDELVQVIGEEIIPYIRDYCIPFWEEYQDLNKVVELISNTQELSTIFSGEVDFEVIALLWLNKSYLYHEKKDEFLKNQQELADYSLEYKMYPKAFSELIDSLENSNNTE